MPGFASKRDDGAAASAASASSVFFFGRVLPRPRLEENLRTALPDGVEDFDTSLRDADGEIVIDLRSGLRIADRFGARESFQRLCSRRADRFARREEDGWVPAPSFI